MTPVMICLTPSPTPKVSSIAESRKRKRAAPQRPGTLPSPPATAVPPMTTTAIDVMRYGEPMFSAAPPEKDASSSPASAARRAEAT